MLTLDVVNRAVEQVLTLDRRVPRELEPARNVATGHALDRMDAVLRMADTSQAKTLDEALLRLAIAYGAAKGMQDAEYPDWELKERERRILRCLFQVRAVLVELGAKPGPAVEMLMPAQFDPRAVIARMTETQEGDVA